MPEEYGKSEYAQIALAVRELVATPAQEKQSSQGCTYVGRGWQGPLCAHLCSPCHTHSSGSCGKAGTSSLGDAFAAPVPPLSRAAGLAPLAMASYHVIPA